MQLTNRSDLNLLSDQCFVRALYLERKRAERSGRGFVLMLLEPSSHTNAAMHGKLLRAAAFALTRVTRDTDIRGWFAEGSVLGVLFTEFGILEAKSAQDLLAAKVSDALAAALAAQAGEISLSSYVFSGQPNQPSFEPFEYAATTAGSTFGGNSAEKATNS